MFGEDGESNIRSYALNIFFPVSSTVIYVNCWIWICICHWSLLM